MGDHKGDEAKQPPECKSVFTPFSVDFPRDPRSDAPNAEGRWSKCPNLKETGGGMDGEWWSCEVCGKRYFLDYDEMR